MSPEDLAAFHAGDHPLFRAIVEQYSDRLLGLCRGFAPDLDAAHDLVQETWLRVYDRRRTYRGGSLVAWLLTVCRRVCLSRVRAGGERVERLDCQSVDAASTSPKPDRDAANSEARRAITRALFDLSERQREVVVYRLIEGLSTRETAARMACAEGTVKATLHQAVARLREPLASYRLDGGSTADPRPSRTLDRGTPYGGIG